MSMAILRTFLRITKYISPLGSTGIDRDLLKDFLYY